MKPCFICLIENYCDCNNAITKYFDILSSAEQKVLSAKASSTTKSLEPCAAGIDKLNGYFTNSILASEILKSAAANNYEIKRVFLKDRSEYLQVRSLQKQIHLKLDITKTYATGFIANPNYFASWDEFTSFFTLSTTAKNLNEIGINRIDLNLDYPIEFKEFIKRLEVTNKRASLTFIDEAGVRSGLIIGKGNETIAVYDKSKQAKLASTVTRMEVRLKQTKLPSKTLDAFSEAILNKTFFESLKLVDLSYHPTHLSEQSLKQARFKLNCERDGYFLARKLENQNRNFDRDFKKIISVTLNATQPSDQFKRHVGGYFNSNKEEKHV